MLSAEGNAVTTHVPLSCGHVQPLSWRAVCYTTHILRTTLSLSCLVNVVSHWGKEREDARAMYMPAPPPLLRLTHCPGFLASRPAGYDLSKRLSVLPHSG